MMHCGVFFFFFITQTGFAHLLSKGFNRRFHPQLLPLLCLLPHCPAWQQLCSPQFS